MIQELIPVEYVLKIVKDTLPAWKKEHVGVGEPVLLIGVRLEKFVQ